MYKTDISPCHHTYSNTRSHQLLGSEWRGTSAYFPLPTLETSSPDAGRCFACWVKPSGRLRRRSI